MLKLIGLGLNVKYQEWKEFVCVLWRFRACKIFLLSYCLLKFLYLFSGPYSVSRRYLKWMNADDFYSYGETPLMSLASMADRIGLSGDDHVFELGAGSGFTSLWLNLVAGCRVTAIEQVPGFVWRLSWVVRLLRISGVNVCREDYLNSDLSSATIIYLFASDLDDVVITQLAEKLALLSAGTRIVTVSYSLQPYIDQPAFEVMDQFEACFPWGAADVYVQRVCEMTRKT
ncbi:class I SAM-dependent methyltransferase [Endozoicomonas montiporae]|uniref:Uncharacterized protein n=1 Tax=Endozoicomonas montiporae CL-33 TaxID=570277 RepID=A0A142BGT8_9GAMM|nr:hypothetical protein [Endozoicomonas montiporae]AMO57964.1 hypothetical protein EZMO1_4029 [Endozoicomonas montiporae CL-33]